MAYMGNLKKGDRVKVTIEADVLFGSSFGVDLDVGGGTVTLREETWRGLEFEKIEPPVEQFGPGDVVRSKLNGDIRALGHDGWFNITTRTWHRGDVSLLTSEGHEKVSIE